jgi:hypothetical protein
MRRVRALAIGIALLVPAATLAQSAPPSGIAARLGTPTLHGAAVVPSFVPIDGRRALIGGLSGIDFDPTAEGGDPVFFVIGDGRAARLRPGLEAPRAVYRVRLAIREDGLVGQPAFLEERRIERVPDKADPEAIRFDPQRGRLYWTSEEEPPALRVMSTSGAPLAEATRPAGYVNTVVDNRGFEGLALSADGARLFAALEAPLSVDGAASSVGAASKIRIVEFAAADMAAARQYVYCLDPILKAPAGGRHAELGVSEIMWAADDLLLVLERGYTAGYEPGKANSVRIYAVDLRRAPQAPRDVSETEMRALVARTDCAAYPKELFVDLETFGIWIDNVEGMTFGRPFANGDRSVVLVTDDNFAQQSEPPWMQITQFIVLRLKQPR